MPPEVKTIRIDRAIFQQTLEKNLADLPPLPAVVTRIMQTINDPNVSAEELNRLISLDQGLSSKILRIVNSAYYGFPKRISTITHAVVILGFNTVRNLVLGVSAFGMLPQKTGTTGLNRQKFWEHCVAVAVACSLIAKRKQLRSRNVVEEAFISGLLHDIGELFLDSYFPVQYAVSMAYAAREQITMFDAERALLDIDYVLVAKRIADHWNFPPSLAAAVGNFQSPLASADYFESSALVHAADRLVWQCGLGSPDNVAVPPMSPVVEAWLGFSDAELEQVKEEILQQFAAAQDLLKLAQAA